MVLTASGDNKINVIKEVRTITGLGLKEAKDLVEAATPGAPKVVKDALNKDDAEKMKKLLVILFLLLSYCSYSQKNYVCVGTGLFFNSPNTVSHKSMWSMKNIRSVSGYLKCNGYM